MSITGLGRGGTEAVAGKSGTCLFRTQLACVFVTFFSVFYRTKSYDTLQIFTILYYASKFNSWRCSVAMLGVSLIFIVSWPGYQSWYGH
jgi:hypothetical protein